MNQFKIENFRKSHPDSVFPFFKQIDAEACSVLARRIALAIGLTGSTNVLALIRRLVEVESEIGILSENDLSSSLVKILDQATISFSEFVYVNWYRFDSVDQMRYSDFVKNIEDIWYPSSDDVDIFDDTCSSIVSITHFGAVRAVRFQNLERKLDSTQ
jgi:hypothetical protein